jgi:hypothetical protein
MANPTQTQITPLVAGNPEIKRNSIYICFNSPEVDEYHRSIFITYPPTHDGTLFHAKYTSESGWMCERREVKNLSKARSLVLLYRLGSLLDGEVPETWFAICESILTTQNMDAQTDRTDDLVQRLGNSKLGGYSCVIWSVDVVAELAKAGLVDLNGFSAEEKLMSARLIAGPKDGRTMVGKDHGPFRVVNSG